MRLVLYEKTWWAEQLLLRQHCPKMPQSPKILENALMSFCVSITIYDPIQIIGGILGQCPVNKCCTACRVLSYKTSLTFFFEFWKSVKTWSSIIYMGVIQTSHHYSQNHQQLECRQVYSESMDFKVYKKCSLQKSPMRGRVSATGPWSNFLRPSTTLTYFFFHSSGLDKGIQLTIPLASV